MEDRRLDVASATIVVCCLFELPSVSALVMEKARVVISFIEVFQDGGKDLGKFFRKVDTFCGCFEKLTTADGSEERGV